jgi:hypothetical protein
MATITMPTGGISNISWKLPRHPTFGVRSSWTGKQQVIDIGATQGWQAEVSVAPKTEAQALAWLAFFARLKGLTNDFLLPARPGPAIFNAELFGAAQTGSTITIKNVPTSVPITAFRKAGHFLHIATSAADWRMFMLTEDLDIGGDGTGTMHIEPSIVTAYPDSTDVEFSVVLCRMRLISPETGWSLEPGKIYRPFSFQCEEVI